MPVKFDRQHYNSLAKISRETFPIDIPHDQMQNPLENLNVRIKREQHVFLLLEMAKYFIITDELFDPHLFLDQCSPDVDVYPLSELWEEYSG